MAERSSAAGSVMIEPSRTFPERENPHGRGRRCPDAAGGNRGLGGEARALPTGPLRSVHHPVPHTSRTVVRGRRHTHDRQILSSRPLHVAHHPSRPPRAIGRPWDAARPRSSLWKANASKPSTLTATLSTERVFGLRKSRERRIRVARRRLRHRSRVLVANARDLRDGVNDVRRLVVDSTEGLRSEERRVGLDEDP